MYPSRLVSVFRIAIHRLRTTAYITLFNYNLIWVAFRYEEYK
jgi:hypothetical protein